MYTYIHICKLLRAGGGLWSVGGLARGWRRPTPRPPASHPRAEVYIYVYIYIYTRIFARALCARLILRWTKIADLIL